MGRAVARDHDDKRRAILKAAARVFARDGFARASMAGIAAECGISKANLYHYHAGKDGLLFDLLDAHLSDLRDRFAAVDLTGPDPLRALLTDLLLAYEGRDDEHRIQTEAMTLVTPVQAAILRGYQRDMVARLSDVLAAQAPHLDRGALRDATMSVFGMVNWFYLWSPRADRAARIAYAGTVADIARGGVGAIGT